MFYKLINNCIIVGRDVARNHKGIKFSIANGFQITALTKQQWKSKNNVSTCGKKDNATNLLLSCGESHMYKLEAKF